VEKTSSKRPVQGPIPLSHANGCSVHTRRKAAQRYPWWIRLVPLRQPNAPKKKESKFTDYLLEIFDAINPSLTPEQRWAEVAEIVAPHTVKIIREKLKQSGKQQPKPPKPGTKNL